MGLAPVRSWRHDADRALSGGSGSGKSSVAAQLAGLGAVRRHRMPRSGCERPVRKRVRIPGTRKGHLKPRIPPAGDKPGPLQRAAELHVDRNLHAHHEPFRCLVPANPRYSRRP